MWDSLSHLDNLLLKAHSGLRNNCFSKIQLVGQKNFETKHLALFKVRL